MQIHTPYLCDEMITVITSDNRKIIHCRDLLTARFCLVAEVCEDLDTMHELHVNLDWSHLKKILLFTDKLHLPSSKKGWIKLLQAADYFILSPSYNQILDHEVRNFLVKEKIPIYVPVLTFRD